MMTTFIKLAVRNLFKRKGYLVINILGLSIGLVSFLLIMEFVIFEKSYDTFHKQSERIYRVGFDWGEIDLNGVNSSRYASNVPVIGPTLVHELPEVESYTRFFRVLTIKPFCVFTYRENGEIKYSGNADEGFYADNNFLRIFTFPILKGDANPLNLPRSIAITESFAKKIFGDTPYDKIIGQGIEIDNRTSDLHVVTAILQDVPTNSHIDFDYLISWSTLNNPALEGNLWWSQFYTYILFREDINSSEIELKFTPLIEKLYGEESHISIFLQPLRDIYLTSEMREEVGPIGSSQQLTFLTIIAYAILFMAWINYMNMFFAKSIDRANEVGVKKVLGSGAGSLVIQFFIESLLINIISLVINIFLLFSVQSYFELWLGKDISIIFTDRLHIVLIVFAGVLLGSVITGLYPAIILSSYRPIEILGAKLKSSKGGIIFQKSLVYFQFIISFIIVSCTLIVGRQINFMEKHDIGLTLDGCIAVRTPGNIDSLYNSQVLLYKDRLRQYPFIKGITFASSIPGKIITTSGGMKKFEMPEFKGNNVFKIDVDEGFLDSYDIRLLSGRNFTQNQAHENEKIIINQAALSTLDFKSADEAINQKVNWGDRTFEIIGVFSNYNHLFLKESFEPIILNYNAAPIGFFTLKIEEGHDKIAIEKAKNEMNLIFPANPFDYQYLNETYKRQYEKIHQFDVLTKYFALTAIFIAGLGLFALSAYSMQNKIKEVAVRKIYGASLQDVMLFLSKQYIVIALISGILGSSITYFIMSRWLENFAFSIRLNFVDFIIPLVSITGIVLATVSYNCFRTAIVSPSRSLKYE